MKSKNVIKSLVLCLFCLLSFAGCQKKYPGVYEYTGVWDFCVHLEQGHYGWSHFTPTLDTIINYTGRIAYAGSGLLLIEFNQNECMEAKLGYDGKIWNPYNGHAYYSEQPRLPYGEFIGTENIKMDFKLVRGDNVNVYQITGSKRN